MHLSLQIFVSRSVQAVSVINIIRSSVAQHDRMQSIAGRGQVRVNSRHTLLEWPLWNQ